MSPKTFAAAAVLCATFVVASEAGAVMLLPKFPAPGSNSSAPPNGNGNANENGNPQTTPNPPQTWPPGDLTLVDQTNTGNTNAPPPRARALPEPGTFALLVAGFAGIACSARRNKSS